jgi:hypothetical protein
MHNNGISEFGGEAQTMEEETKFHWSEGMKYALEGITTLFVLNGAATISVLTFVGNTKSQSKMLIFGMVCFALGAATGPVALWLAYMTQLMYGNSARSQSGQGDRWSSASRYHSSAYLAVGFGLLMFLVGIALAGFGLLRPQSAV